MRERRCWLWETDGRFKDDGPHPGSSTETNLKLIANKWFTRIAPPISVEILAFVHFDCGITIVSEITLELSPALHDHGVRSWGGGEELNRSWLTRGPWVLRSFGQIISLSPREVEGIIDVEAIERVATIRSGSGSGMQLYL